MCVRSGERFLYALGLDPSNDNPYAYMKALEALQAVLEDKSISDIKASMFLVEKYPQVFCQSPCLVDLCIL